MIDMDHVQDVCKIGQGAECCTYLIGGPRGLECAKDSEEGRRIVESRRPHMIAQGDNCPGWSKYTGPASTRD